MTQVFNRLRTLCGDTLTQTQVDAGNRLLGFANESVLLAFLGELQSMKTSQAGQKLIQSFESLRLVAYNDGVNVWTIGYGTTVYPTGIKVKQGDTCTLSQAAVYFAHDLLKFGQAVNDAVKVPLNQNQLDALVSLTYNIGINAFKSSTLLKNLNAGDYVAAADQFLVWNRGGGKVMQGLVSRRKAERSLFLE